MNSFMRAEPPKSKHPLKDLTNNIMALGTKVKYQFW